MAVTFSRLKFKRLTDFMGDSVFLNDIGSVYKNSNTPYEATYQINFSVHGTAYTHYIATASTIATFPITDTYAGAYKIYDFNYNLNRNIKIQLSLNASTEFIDILCLSANRGFKTNVKNSENLLNYSYDYENIKHANGTSISSSLGTTDPALVFTPDSIGTDGYIRFSVKFYNKYIVTGTPE